MAVLLPGASAHRHVAEGSAHGPVALALAAEVAGLVDAVVVIVTELGVHGLAARARKDLLRLLTRGLGRGRRRRR